jgi:hypothetical protein
MGDSVQKEMSKLLPFHLNGTLSENERQSVERALAADPGLREELAFLRHVQTAVREDDLGRSPGEMGLARLKRDLSSAKKPSWTARAAAIAAAFALGAMLSAVATGRYFQKPEGYSQAGAPVAGKQLVVAFRQDATAEQISDLLLSQDTTIADGPSAIGLYRIAIADGIDAKTVAAALAAATDVVESVEEAQ